jgi:hypothetical protein
MYGDSMGKLSATYSFGNTLLVPLFRARLFFQCWRVSTGDIVSDFLSDVDPLSKLAATTALATPQSRREFPFSIHLQPIAHLCVTPGPSKVASHLGC